MKKTKLIAAALLVGILSITACGPSEPGKDDSQDATTSEVDNSSSSSSSEDVNKEFKVTFTNYDDSVLFTDIVKKGEDAVYEGKTPIRPEDENYRYEFIGWDKSLKNIRRDTTVKAQYKSFALHVREDYDAWANEVMNEQGHVYFHYLRDGASSEEYNDWALWLWQNSPTDSEGTLWGCSDEKVATMFHPMSLSWVDNIGGSGQSADQAGRVLDIDLNKEGLVGGKSGKPVTLIDAKKLGFLIIRQDSMYGGHHWVSDGGSNTYIPGFDEELAKKGYVHIYVIQGMVGEFTFEYTAEILPNPVVSDKTGQYRSSTDIDSSENKFGVSKTSDSFNGLGVGYQIFVSSFRDSNGDGLGDIQGIINSLDYLQELGVEVLWLTPIQACESYHGYDIIDFYAVDSKFGTEKDYQNLLYEAHERGMKVLMDFVVNHTSKNNVWFKKSQKAEKGVDEFGNEINYRDMYHWKFKGDKVLLQTNGVYKEVNVEDHPDWYRDGESDYYYYGKFGSNMAELNYDCQATRNLVINMAMYWLGFGLDGFRLDAVKHIYMKDEVTEESSKGDTVITDIGSRTYYDDEKMETVTVQYDYSSDMTKNVNFWKEFAVSLKALYPDCFLVGENFDGWGARIAPYYQALDSQFDFALFYHNLEFLYGLPSGGAYTLSNKHAEETYERYSATTPTKLGDTGITAEGGKRFDFINSPFTSNHDTPRLINHISGSVSKNSDGTSKLTPNEKVTGTEKEINRAKVAAATTILTPGLSWIYYGDELGMSGNTDKHIELYKNKNNEDLWYRQPFKWGDETETNYGFNSYKIEMDDYNKNTLKSATEQSTSNTDNDMFDYYQQLIAVKKLYGRNAKWVSVKDSTNSNDLVHFRVVSDEGTFEVYVNSGASNKTIKANNVNSSKVILNLNGAETNGSIAPYGVLVTKA